MANPVGTLTPGAAFGTAPGSLVKALDGSICSLLDASDYATSRHSVDVPHIASRLPALSAQMSVLHRITGTPNSVSFAIEQSRYAHCSVSLLRRKCRSQRRRVAALDVMCVRPRGRVQPAGRPYSERRRTLERDVRSDVPMPALATTPAVGGSGDAYAQMQPPNVGASNASVVGPKQ